jgi:hypothetical protein
MPVATVEPFDGLRALVFLDGEKTGVLTGCSVEEGWVDQIDLTTGEPVRKHGRVVILITGPEFLADERAAIAKSLAP